MFFKKILFISSLLILSFIPPIASFSMINWQIFLIFIFTILNFILNIFHVGTMSIFSIAYGGIFKIFSMNDALQSFCNPIIWQIISIFFIAKGLVNSGLAKNFSLLILKRFGKNLLTLAYAFNTLNFVLALFIPSSTARIGGIILPILNSIFNIFKTFPEDKNKVGKFLIFSSLYGNAIISSTLLSATSANFLIQNFSKAENIQITWINWFIAGFFPAFCCFFIIPYILYKILKPNNEDFKTLKNKLDEEFSKIEKFNFKQIIMSCLLIILLASWIMNSQFNLDITLILFSILSIMLLFEIISFEEDILKEKDAWSLFFWLSTLLMIISLLKKHGTIDLISNFILQIIFYIPNEYVLFCLLIINGYTHYFFASITSHISVIYPILLNIAIKYNQSLLTALMLAFTSNLFAGLTKYSSTESVIFANTKYLKDSDFLKYGFIITTISFIIWMLSGIIWWKIIGYY